MRRLSENKGVAWAAISIVSLVFVLFAMTSVSGGFTGLSGTLESLGYAGVVAVPLLVVVFLALWKPGDTAKNQEEVLARIPVKD